MNPAPTEDVPRTTTEWELARRREQQRRSDAAGDRIERVWDWVESRPALIADHELACAAVSAILMRRVPPGLLVPGRRDELEQWLLERWARTRVAA